MDSSGVRRIVTMRKRFGTTKGVTRIGLTQTARRIEMETNKSVGTVDIYLHLNQVKINGSCL